MRKSTSNRVWIVALLLALTITAGHALAGSIDIPASHWARLSGNGEYDSVDCAGPGCMDAYLVGYYGNPYFTDIRAYWGFALPNLGTVTGVTFNLYSATVNISDLANPYRTVSFMAPTSLTFNGLVGGTEFASYTYYGPRDSWNDVALAFNPARLGPVNAAQGSTLYVSAVMDNTGGGENLAYINSFSVDTMSLHVDYTENTVPEPGYLSLIGAGVAAVFAVRRKRARI